MDALTSRDLVTAGLSTTVLAIGISKFYKWFQIRSKLPPGPTGVPILGYAPFLGRFPHLKFCELAKTYGPVFSISIFSTNMVVLNDFKTIKEAYGKDEFLGRPIPTLFSPIGQPVSLVDGSGEMWKEQRRFALHHLRDHGFGKSGMEEKIREEIQYLVKEIVKQLAAQGTANSINIHQLLTPSVSNNICILIFGKRFDYNDPDRIAMDNALATVPQFIGPTGLLFMFPSLATLFMKLGVFGFEKLWNAFMSINAFVKREVARHEATLDENNPRDYIDSFLVEQQRREKSGQGMGTFDFGMLTSNTRGFFGAGSETIRTTTVWAMMLMAVNSEVQAKVQRELDDVIGRDRSPAWNDRLHVPYTQAVLMEIQRWASAVAVSVPRRAVTDASVGGHTVAKDTVVTANLWAVHHDPEIWEQPDDFFPGHFYDDKNNSVIKNEALIPFSLGKRNCVGESLAQVELFLYFASILQAFKIEPPGGNVPLSFDRVLGITLQPKEIPLLRFTRRI